MPNALQFFFLHIAFASKKKDNFLVVMRDSHKNFQIVYSLVMVLLLGNIQILPLIAGIIHETSPVIISNKNEYISMSCIRIKMLIKI